ncbi:heme oxygenase-like protein [Plenodomus tracheiphilus IPT5]|uniref:Heme oxygenase-like protein n=1 Tax=Plenodomus tracheiphilus IPT5 TaxID=1408161 RepID=A0A6A7BG03_9PLEO|nr:heme oxygenase-like protein [Plenodomus tracheiphilus IPT5]
MPRHHPGTFIAHNDVDMTDVPWAVTTHLLSINHQQFLRATRHSFLARAANGTLPKPIVARWLANDREYLKGYVSTISNTLGLLRSQRKSTTATEGEPDIETRLIAWLESALQNGEREIRFFQEVAEIYKIDIASSPLNDGVKLEGLRRYETLFSQVASQPPNVFIPWLEGAILLWATEKAYYDSFSWARRQDAQSSPKNYEKDLDGGAMRRELIPNWSNRDFLMFVEQLERIVNEGVSEAVNRDDAKWAEVKQRTDVIWQAVLDAEEAFWPDVENGGKQLKEAVVGGPQPNTTATSLNSTSYNEVLDGKRIEDVKWNGHIPLV